MKPIVKVVEKKPKVIYVTRNPRDVIASFHNHWTILDGYTVRARKYNLKGQCHEIFGFKFFS
jgi:hypothetical protein